MTYPVNTGSVAQPFIQVDSSGNVVTFGAGANSQNVQGATADGASATGTNPVQIGGVDGSGNVQALLTTTTGALNLSDLRSSTGTKTSVASNASSVTILASNANRKGATIANTDANILYLDLSGGTASATSFTVALGAGTTLPTYYEIPYGYSGAITGIWASAGAGAAKVTEFV